MLKTYQTKKFYEVVGLLSNVSKANEIEVPLVTFQEICIKPSFNEEGKADGFNVSIITINPTELRTTPKN